MFGHDGQQPTANDSTAPVAAAPIPAGDTPMPTAPMFGNPAADGAADSSSATAQTPPPENSNTDDLLSIKQDALKQLSPLVSHLDQSPEEKFRTTMMMIQAADDQSLVKDAYEAAQNISDEKARAQALLDIVNEINYFTQHNA
jgi:hypothetical protein